MSFVLAVLLVRFDNLREVAPTHDHIVVEFGEVGYACPFGSGELARGWKYRL